MGRQIAKQPDGLYSVWSSVVDDFIFVDATEKQVRDFWMTEAISNTVERVNKDLEEAFSHIEKYGHDTWGQTYEDFVGLRDIIGKEINNWNPNCEDCDPDYPRCDSCMGA